MISTGVLNCEAFGEIAANEQVLPMVGELKNLRLATEVRYLFKDE